MRCNAVHTHIIGLKGQQGPHGLTGPQGAKGFAGSRGQKGDRGQQGLHGLTGQQGPKGVAGSRGQKGDRGQQGIQGQTGGQGPMGPTGSKGQKGERGVNGLRGPPGPSTGGVVYTRWGKNTCPNTTGTQLLYAGRAAGSYFTEQGGGANHLCLPEQPQYSIYTAGRQSGRAYLYGAEYQTGAGYANSPLRSFHDYNVPCAVCYSSTRETVVMIPARLSCPSSWTREYYGYLMAERYNHRRSTFECVDRYPQSVPGSIANTDGALFYHTEVKCNGIPCPPYVTQKEVTCVVCTK